MLSHHLVHLGAMGFLHGIMLLKIEVQFKKHNKTVDYRLQQFQSLLYMSPLREKQRITGIFKLLQKQQHTH